MPIIALLVDKARLPQHQPQRGSTEANFFSVVIGEVLVERLDCAVELLLVHGVNCEADYVTREVVHLRRPRLPQRSLVDRMEKCFPSGLHVDVHHVGRVLYDIVANGLGDFAKGVSNHLLQVEIELGALGELLPLDPCNVIDLFIYFEWNIREWECTRKGMYMGMGLIT